MRFHYGKFQNEDGRIINSEPGPGDPFPIRCGAWPNPHPGAMQRIRCACGEWVGVSPKGWAYHEAQPELRPLFCSGCFEFLTEMMRK